MTDEFDWENEINDVLEDKKVAKGTKREDEEDVDSEEEEKKKKEAQKERDAKLKENSR